jgi:exopolyphosphatase/guanosine-5'-triphosphate,3'-diphosphate pyrophosphatase
MRLVIDIGGGSTEFILGRHFDPLHMDSLHMGCVSMSAQYFGDGVVNSKRMRAAEIAARQELGPVGAEFRRVGWQSVIGASGTNLAIREVVTAEAWSKDGITLESLYELRAALIDAGRVDKISLSGLPPERKPVFPGGVAVLIGAFEELSIDHMRVSDSALREGLIYDLLGRIQHEDVREQTIEHLIDRYDIDHSQSARIGPTGSGFFDQLAEQWGLGGEESKRLLRWAVALHEIGHAISHSQYHKHGGYLLTHLDMPGFARGEQQRLACLVRGHRRKVPIAEFDKLPKPTAKRIFRLCIILRLAVVLHRRRNEAQVPLIGLDVDERMLRMKFPEGWLSAHPLTQADLEQEALYLKAVDFKLRFK